jgi:hypothetical protein
MLCPSDVDVDSHVCIAIIALRSCLFFPDWAAETPNQAQTKTRVGFPSQTTGGPDDSTKQLFFVNDGYDEKSSMKMIHHHLFFHTRTRESSSLESTHALATVSRSAR